MALPEPSSIGVGRPLAEDFVESEEHASKLLLGSMRDSPADPVHRERSDLTDLYPGAFRETDGLALEGQGKPGPRLLARHRDGDHGPGSLVEDIVAEDEDWALAGLLTPANGIEVSPANLAS